jgi:hypothetical protein
MIVEASSVAANARHRILERAAREHRRAKTGRLDSELLKRVFPSPNKSAGKLSQRLKLVSSESENTRRLLQPRWPIIGPSTAARSNGRP